LELHHQSFEVEGCTRRTAWKSGRYKPSSKAVKKTLKIQPWTTPTHTLIGVVLLEIAMQGAIARIWYKYHYRFSSTTPYYQFGERNEEGCAMDRRDLETHSLLRTYMTEREYSAVNTEDMLTRQIKLMDKFKRTMEVSSQRIITAESCLEVMGDKRAELMEENEALKKKITEYEAKALEDEDPKELTLYNTNGEEITVDEWEARVVRKAKKARAARLEAKRRTTLPLACLNRIKRR
jgi:hypothetical protein